MASIHSRMICRVFLSSCCAFYVAASTAAEPPPAPPAKAKTSVAKPAAKKTGTTTFVPKTTIVWRGDIVSSRGFANELVEAFRNEQQGLLTVQTFSTISGIDAVIDGSADVAGSARGMDQERETERNLVFQPIALDAIVPVTHPRNPVSGISLAHLRQIYLGRITNWKDLGGTDAPINLYSVAAPLDGLEFSFRRLLYRKGGQRISAPRLYLNTSKLEEGVTLDPNGLGLTTLSSSFENKGMKLLAVEGVTASTLSISNGSYPLFTLLYIVQREDAVNRAEIDAFVAFLNSPSVLQLMRQNQLVPIADAGDVYALDGARLALIDSAIVSVTPADVAAMPREREVPAPMSAPRATLESRLSIAPTAETTEQARENLIRAEAMKAEEAGATPPPAKSD